MESNIDYGQVMEQIVTFISEFGLRVLAAIAILIVGRIAANIVSNGARKAMHRADVDENLIGFVASLVRFGILAFTFIAVLSKLGVQTTSFVAVLGAAGLAVGLALQGSLGNFASGVLLLLFRPIKKGDFVEAGGTSGSVNEISVFTTILMTPDNKKVIVPNSQVTGGIIINYSATGTRRVDLVAGIGYSDDIAKAKEVLKRIVAAHPAILPEPAPVIEVAELGDSSVNLVVRPWVNSGDYWRVYWDLTESIKLEFDKEGISIPFPQRDVHLFQESASA
jgi:small conductance mechanosensitive channel